jgi:type I restriction enzyme S subunit
MSQDEAVILCNIPRTWAWTAIGDIASKVEKIDPNDDPEREFVYLDIASIEGSTKEITSPKRYLGKVAPSRARQLVRSGDILFSTVRTYLKKIAMVKEIYDGQVASTGFCVIRPLDPISRKLVLYYVQTDSFVNPLTQIQRGTSYPAVRDSDVFAQPVPIPPLNEQDRIVAKVEELFTKLDAGVKSLETVKAQLKRYRRSVLKSAFEGKLTEEWRLTHRNELEPAAKQLEFIREGWSNSTAGEYKEPPPVDTANLLELPQGWVWTRVGNIVESMKNGIYKPRRFYDPNGVACLRMYNIEDGSIVWKNIKRMNLSSGEVQEYGLRPGDILVNRVNSRELVGKAAPIPENMEIAVFESKNIRLRLYRDYAEPRFVSSWFRIFRRQYFNWHAQQVVGMASINQDQVAAMPIPLAPRPEQQKIVDEIEHRFSIVDEVEETAVNNLKQAEKLRQSILKRAFAGRLVSQDPTDEPASALLERIKSLKTQIEHHQRTRKTKRPNDHRQRRLM